MKKNKGFTLIELLVVIAIIGLLSTIVLVSLNSARNRAKDTRIKADLAQIRSVAELNADANSTYVLSGEYDKQHKKLDADINAQVAQNPRYWADSDEYMAQAKLTGSTYAGWCVDSTGASKAVTVDVSASPANGSIKCGN